MNIDPQFPVMNLALLTGIVRRALGSESAEVGDWEVRRLHGGIGTFSGGIYHLTGVTQDEDSQPWSLVLKVLRPPVERMTAATIPLEAWAREAHVYRSGVLGDLPAGFTVPRCFEVTEQPDGIGLWLEQITDEVGARWSPADFARAARHLGRFNGSFLTVRPLPDYPWLQHDILRYRAGGNTRFWEEFPQLRTSDEVPRFWPDDVGNRAYRLWQKREQLLATLDRVPHTLVHGDADRRNLLMRHGSGGLETVAIDWAFAGVAALGEELVNLVIASVLWFQADVVDLRELFDTCLAAYVEGLSDVGWQGDPRQVEVAFVIASALRYGPFVAAQVARMTPESLARAAGQSVETFLDRWTTTRRFTFDRLDAAWDVIASL